MYAVKLLLFVGFVSCKSVTKNPTFTWLKDTSSAGVPLLQVDFHDGNNVDVALLSPFNPIPQGLTERSEEIDSCIYEGYLKNEKDVYVTLTGCPLSDSFQIQFRSSRLRSSMFIVNDGKAEVVVDNREGMDFVQDYLEIPDEFKSKPNKTNGQGERALSPTGYIITLKIFYDDNWSNKWGADAINAIRRVLAHAQNIWQWSSAPSKMVFSVDPVVQKLPGVWTASYSIDSLGSNNIGTVNTNVYLCVQNAASGSAVGIAYRGGACSSHPEIKSLVTEWYTNDLATARTLAHEIAHSTGVLHDFNIDPSVSRFDSKGRRCLDQGGIMDYSIENENDKSSWSTCSIEDFTKSMSDNPKCLTPITSTNLPAATVKPPLTVLECQLGPAFATLNGVHTLYLNGYQSMATCVNGVCAANYDEVSNACQYLCGKDSCQDAVNVGPCDLSKVLNQDFSGISFACINGNYVVFECNHSLCMSLEPPSTNSCVSLCGQSDCSTAKLC